ncbi:MAG: hypothetical protein B6D37_09245 [Sphingobacteriales bacterium UTBCD1]|jgi:YegS/Rv2252/BmrU family lipid kinase|nr:MAG: hypothetical protein B6D37_09245 [Sphingobacteriales bacterium UTBCD1]
MNDATIASAKTIAIACNPLAGDGRAVSLTGQIADELVKRDIAHSVFKDNWPENFNGFTDVWIVGGDGTLNYFINNYPEIRLPLSVFKGGSGNDSHWLLYGNKNFTEQLEFVLSARAKAIDAGRCNDKFFINGAGIGFEGVVSESVGGKKKSAGKISYLLAILKKILFYHSKSYTICSEEYNEQKKFLMISVCNGRRAGGGFYVAPEAQADDGLLDVSLIRAIPPFLRLRCLPAIEKGTHLLLPFVSHFKTRKIIIESDQMIQAHLDGEIFNNKKLEFEILPGKFHFLY